MHRRPQARVCSPPAPIPRPIFPPGFSTTVVFTLKVRQHSLPANTAARRRRDIAGPVWLLLLLLRLLVLCGQYRSLFTRAHSYTLTPPRRPALAPWSPGSAPPRTGRRPPCGSCRPAAVKPNKRFRRAAAVPARCGAAALIAAQHCRHAPRAPGPLRRSAQQRPADQLQAHLLGHASLGQELAVQRQHAEPAGHDVGRWWRTAHP